MTITAAPHVPKGGPHRLIAAIGEDHILIGECKWSINPVGTNVLDDLQRTAHALLARDSWSHVHLALFARAGFTPALEQRAANEGITLVDLTAICR